LFALWLNGDEGKIFERYERGLVEASVHSVSLTKEGNEISFEKRYTSRRGNLADGQISYYAKRNPDTGLLEGTWRFPQERINGIVGMCWLSEAKPGDLSRELGLILLETESINLWRDFRALQKEFPYTSITEI